MVSIETADYFADYDVVSMTAYAGNNGSGTILDSMTLDGEPKALLFSPLFRPPLRPYAV